jgi:hypothetical protein
MALITDIQDTFEHCVDEHPNGDLFWGVIFDIAFVMELPPEVVCSAAAISVTARRDYQAA